MRSRIKILRAARGARGRRVAVRLARLARPARPTCPTCPQARLPRWVRASVRSRLHPLAPPPAGSPAL